MKLINRKYGKLLLLTAATSMVFFSCKKSFLDGNPDDTLSVDDFYTTPEQVQAATASMYGYTWYYFNSKFNIGLGDVYAGNAYCDYSDAVQFQRFAVSNTNQFVSEGWGSLYTTISDANSIIKNVPEKGVNLDPAVISEALAEARFIRATAYFYLVRAFGPVPIITDATVMLDNYKVPRIVEEDVYRFIIEDLQYAAANLPNMQTDKGRVNAGAAKGMLAKVYLQMKDYANAKKEAGEVISNVALYGFGLEENYADLFYTSKENGKESMFALQWVSCQNYGTGNENQAYFAPYGQGLTGFTDGWGTFVPSLDIQNYYDTLVDLRLQPSMFRQGYVYPQLKSADGGYTYTAAAANSSKTKANIKKYVVGRPTDDNNQGGCAQSYPINTYMLRYADVLLIYTEATMAGGASTGDGMAIDAYNQVHTRAGFDPVTTVTADELLEERRREFAFEGQYWYDLLRLDRAKAKAIIAAQERGTLSNSGTTSYHVTPSDNDFQIPIPQTETDRDPQLLDPPVKYY